MAKIKECYDVLINGKKTLIQVTRTETKKERNSDGTFNRNRWTEVIDEIMKKHFNTDEWEFLKEGEVNTINIRLTI